jgi:putative oxidoreductase
MATSTRNTIAWILQILLALAFIASGANKLLHIPDTVAGFGKMGFPSWFAYFIGVAEVLGGIGLLVLRFTRLAAVGLMLIMLGAAYVHATKIPGGLLPNGFPALILLVLLVVVFLLRRPAPASA